MDFSILQKSPLFYGMTTEDIPEVLASIAFSLRKYNEGALVSQSGEKVPGLLIVVQGVVKGEMMDFTGKVIKIEDIPAPGIIAPAFIFGNRNTFPVNVTAVSDTTLLLIEKNNFLSFLKKNEKILVNYLNLISNRSQFLSDKIRFLNFRTIKGKLAHYILQKTYPDKNELVLELTQGELADFFGVARPSIARVMGELETKGLLLTRGKSIRILDRKGLSELASE